MQSGCGVRVVAPKCNACMSLGHPTKECPSKKPKQPPVSVYVQKPPAPLPREQIRREPENSGGSVTRRVDREEPGKAIVLYNTFDALMVPDSDTDTSKV
ncbi:UNVERIFIED_CONTAM: hypothetical protein Slati_0886300 [Sesamum latifolium]|uniref:CCHC-type domain-containing protein n=1 Tax=Sesamum latifolium TaxID=2727402 RepID=A0AAW2XT45_9LAMI